MTGPLTDTIKALRDLRLEHWNMDACYALDRVIDAATALNNTAPYWNDPDGRLAKLDKHIRRMAIGIAAQYRTEPLTAREIETRDAEERREREEV